MTAGSCLATGNVGEQGAGDVLSSGLLHAEKPRSSSRGASGGAPLKPWPRRTRLKGLPGRRMWQPHPRSWSCFTSFRSGRRAHALGANGSWWRGEQRQSSPVAGGVNVWDHPAQCPIFTRRAGLWASLPDDDGQLLPAPSRLLLSRKGSTPCCLARSGCWMESHLPVVHAATEEHNTRSTTLTHNLTMLYTWRCGLKSQVPRNRVGGQGSRCRVNIMRWGRTFC